MLDTSVTPRESRRVLLIDSGKAMLRGEQPLLRSAGYEVVVAPNPDRAIAALAEGGFDAVVSAANIPGVTAVELLRRIREADLDLSVVLVKDEEPAIPAAVALAHGAFRYLEHPVAETKLRETVALAVAASSVTRLKRELIADRAAVGDQAALEAQFQKGLDQLWMAYQPIVRWSTRTIVAYEALLRSKAPGMGNPLAMLDAADRLGRLPELGRTVRAASAGPWLEKPPPARLFVNLHAADLADDNLFDALSPLGRIARHVALEITERASLDAVAGVRERVARLRAMGFRMALDDIGTGYSGLSTFVLLEPEIVKLDISLIHGIERSPVKQRLVRAVMTMCEGLEVVGEGVETIAERDVLVSLGCDIFQGYLFARPGPPFESAKFEETAQA